MRFFSGARLAGSLVRRSLQSNQSSINHVFQSGICSSSRGLVNSSYEKVLGNNAILGGQFWHPSRAFHGTRPVAVKDYYDVLRVSKTASQSEINKTFDMVERKFQEAQCAYQTLKDEQKRSFYDQVGPDQYEKAASGGASQEGALDGGSDGNPSKEMSGGDPLSRRSWVDVLKEFCVSIVFTMFSMYVVFSLFRDLCCFLVFVLKVCRMF